MNTYIHWDQPYFFMAFKKVEGTFFFFIIHNMWQHVVTCPVHTEIGHKEGNDHFKIPYLGVQFELLVFFFTHPFIFLQSLNNFTKFRVSVMYANEVSGAGPGGGGAGEKPFYDSTSKALHLEVF